MPPTTKTLIIAEKPSAGRDIAAALGAHRKIEGALESDEYVVTWAAGHLVTLKEPHEYKDEWKQWSFASLPILPPRYELKVIDTGKKQYGIIKKFLTSKSFSRVVNACDAGREGELIFDYIYRFSGSKLPAFRLWTSAALTPEAIKREFLKLKPIEEFMGLRLAARARSTADWAIGMNATRAISLAAQRKGHKGVYPVGRVQTPTLQFLVTREVEIHHFKPQKFFVVSANLLTQKDEAFNGRYEYQKDGAYTHQVFSESELDSLLMACQGKDAKVIKVESKDNHIPPPLLFDLTELQKECNRRFSLSADTTLQITQALYEKHKCISYPRTEYRHLTEDNRSMIPAILTALQSRCDEKHIKLAKENLQKENKRIFDNSKVGDHHALIPTAKAPGALNELEDKIYRLIVGRFLAVFADDFLFQSSVIVSLCQKHLFVSRGKTILNFGWKVIEKDDDAEDKKKQEDTHQQLPLVNVGDRVWIKGLTVREDKTKAPPAYNDATLLAAMQNPASKAENKDDKELLRECGLGTPATRAAIIKRLEATGYVERIKKNIKPTMKAFELVKMLEDFNQIFLSNPIMTAEWEKNLQEIEKNPQKASQFLEKLEQLTIEIVEKINYCK